MAKNKKQEDLEQKIGELTLDLQRTRADFENYRKRVDSEKSMARADGRISTISQLLPIIDTIDRAISHIQEDLAAHPWAQGVAQMAKGLNKSLKELNVTRIDAKKGTVFNPEFHQAIQFDEADGENEVIAEELQTGYLLGDDVLRPAMVKVTRK